MSIVSMCHYWDRQGVGFADRAWVGNASQRLARLAPTGSVLELLEVQVLDLEGPPVRIYGPSRKTSNEELAWSDLAVLGMVNKDRLRQGIKVVVHDVKRILLQQATAACNSRCN